MVSYPHIRRTAIRSRKDGILYFTCRMVESQRRTKGVNQQTLLNLGKDLCLPRDQCPELAKRIEDIIDLVKGFLLSADKLENLAQQRYDTQIIQSQDQSTLGDYKEINLESLERLRPIRLVNEHLSLESFRKLKKDNKEQTIQDQFYR